MTTATRAPKGGTVGKNGLHYAGGTFLPTTTLGKLPAKTSKVGGRKVPVAPYKWEVAPEGMFAAFAVNGTLATLNGDKLVPFAPGIATYGSTWKGQDITAICEAYNRGEKWLTIK